MSTVSEDKAKPATIDKERRSAIVKAYIEAINGNRSIHGFAKSMSIASTDLVVIKHRADYRPEIIRELEKFADSVKGGCPEGVMVVLCPEPFDIASMSRDEAVTLLGQLARSIGCEVIDLKDVNHVVFPKLSESAMEEIRGMIEDAPPATILPLSSGN